MRNVIVHPRWFNKAGESPGDVALLKLDRQVIFLNLSDVSEVFKCLEIAAGKNDYNYACMTFHDRT